MKRILIAATLLLAGAFAAPAARATAPTFTKSFSPTTIAVGGTSTLTFNIANNNIGAVNSMAFSDTLPAGLVVATPNGATNTCNGTLTATAGSGSISLSGGTLGNFFGTCAISVNVTATTSGTKNNTTSTLTSSTQTAAAATATLTVTAPETITAVTVGTQTPNPVTANSPATYTITTTWTGSGACTSSPLTINWTAPTGATAAFSPTTVSNSVTTSTLTISTTDSTPAGTTPFTVTAATTAGGACGASSITSASNNLVVQLPRTITATTVSAQNPNPVNPPNSATYTVTTTWTGNGTCTSIPLVFNGTLPTGSTASFSPTTVTSTTTTSTLTITTSATSSASTTPFTVTATSTGGTGNCGTSSVTSSGSNFVIAPQTILTTTVGAQNPNPVAPGSSATYTITTTWSGGAVCTSIPLTINWTAPTGATAAFSPTTVASNALTSTLTISTSASTPAGSTTFTVTASSTGGSGNCGTSSITSSNATLVVALETITTVTVGTQTPNPVGAGSSANYTITTAWTGAGTCTSIPLTINWTAPTGATAAFSPTTVSNGTVTTTLTISTTTATPAGTTPFTVTASTTGGTGACGTSSITSASANLVVTTETITAATMAAQSPSPVIAGASATYAITTTWAGAGSCTSIPLVLNGTLPTGATASFSPTTVSNTATTSTLTISTTTATPAGTTGGLTITASTTGGTGACGTSAITTSPARTLIVTNETITATGVGTQTPNPVVQGNSATYAITTTWAGAGTCTSIPLVLNGTLPSGATAAFSPTTVTNTTTTSTLTISTTGSTPAGTTTGLTVTASTTGGTGACGTSSVNSASFNFVVVTPSAVTAVTVGAQTPSPVNQGSSATYAITTTWTGTATCTPTPTVTFTGGTPTGVTTGFSPTLTSAAPNDTLTISTTSATPANTYQFTVTVTSTAGGNCAAGSATSSPNSTLIVQAIATIATVTLGAETPASVGPAEAATYNVNTTWTGTGTCTPVVTLTWTTTPTGATNNFTPTITSSQTSSTLTINTGAGAATGTYAFKVTVASTGGTGGCGTGSITSASTNFVIATASINSVTVGTQAPNPVVQGNSATFPITTAWSGTGAGCTSIPVTLTWTLGAPTDVNGAFTPTTVSSGSTSTSLTITTGTDTPPGSYFFSVTVANNSGNGCSATNSASGGGTLVVSGNAAPSVTKTFTPANIAPGATSTLTLVLSASPSDISNLTNVSVNDPLPSGMTVSSTSTTNTCSGGSTVGSFSPAPQINDTTINYAGATLAANGSCTITVTVTVPSSGTYNNTTGNPTAGNVATPGSPAFATLTAFGAATQLVFLQGPSNATAGGTIAPPVIVQVEDVNGFVVASSSAPITVAIGTNGGHGTLNGTTTVNAASGMATFSNLSINKPGVYTLTANSPSLTGATSSSFIVQLFNSSGSGSVGSSTTLTYPVPITDPTATNNLLLVGISNPSATTVSTVKWGGASGTALTLVTGCSATGTTLGSAHMEIWSLKNANINVTPNTVVITYGSSQTFIYSGAAMFSNAVLGTCKTSSGGSGSTVSETLPVNANGGAAFDTSSVIAIGGVTINEPSPQLQLWNFAATSGITGSAGAGSYALASTNSITMTTSYSNTTNDYAYGAVPINPVNPRRGEVIIGRLMPTEQPAQPSVVADATKVKNPAVASSAAQPSEERVVIYNLAILPKREDQ